MPDLPAAGPGLTIGTAGHVDHGKTRLVAALTGVDTDRLAEEKRRGISIELGFAELELPAAGSIGIVDVPGHERLVRTMVAGAGAIDLFLLVIAADDGAMPQTIEHLEALRALGVDRGVVALSKADLVDAATLELAREEAVGLVPGAPVIAVSATRGDGIERLREAIDGIAGELAGRHAAARRVRPAPGLLHVDRSFTIAGAGTVVTGTVTGDGFASGDRVRVLPAGLEARVRAIEVHGRPVASAGGGRRAALNLAGTDRRRVPRGSVVSAGEPGPRPAYRLDVLLLGALVEAPWHGRVQVHHGTRDVAARVVPLGGALAQLRLEAPLVARARDRLVFRAIAPPATLGGAEVVDPFPARHGPGPEWPRLLTEGNPEEIVAAAVAAGARIATDPDEWDADSPLAFALVRFGADAWRDAVAGLLAGDRLDAARGVLVPAAYPASPSGAAPAAAPIDRTDGRLLALLAVDDGEPRAPQALADALAIDRADAVRRLDRLAAAGRLRRLGADIYYDPDAIARLEARALELARALGSITLAGIRDSLGSSRKYAQALVEHLDRSGLTVRRGDEHLPRPSASAPRP